MAGFKKGFFTTSSEQERKPEANILTTSSSTQRSSQQKITRTTKQIIRTNKNAKLKQSRLLPSKDKQELRQKFRTEKLTQLSTPPLKTEKRDHSTESIKIITKKQKINEEDPITFDLDQIEIEQMNSEQMKQLIHLLIRNIKKLEEELNSQKEEMFTISQDLINHEDDDEVYMVDRRAKVGRMIFEQCKSMTRKTEQNQIPDLNQQKKTCRSFLKEFQLKQRNRKDISQSEKKNVTFGTALDIYGENVPNRKEQE